MVRYRIHNLGSAAARNVPAGPTVRSVGPNRDGRRPGGPRAALADVEGSPHYFQDYDYAQADEADEADGCSVWPASDVAVELEREHVGDLREIERAL
ncbi:hypothetical protein [Streptomyces olivochromogenes]|uniref:hypothetical protein n=1 Tax=Streptomyces olivochromogenes TaxID=1963 RepID=UPI001F3D292E|nr:hypothetical protein [Streptomyces olivochromogenes]MCF3130195.1 hypothetical protein [Streptomyces olivochromogenes]